MLSCRGCEQKPQRTHGQFRTIGIHTCDAARQKAYQVANPAVRCGVTTAAEGGGLFSEIKNQIGLRRLRLRRIKFYLAAVAQNLKRLARFLNATAQPTMAGAEEKNQLKYSEPE